MNARAIVIMLGLCSACFVDRKSDALACKATTDCTAPRVCEAGFCVIDANACPAECASCDTTVTPHICTITATTAGFTCPSGVECDFTCAALDACKDITCATGSICNVDCSAASACENITCNGRCELRCDAAAACQAVTCTNACACDVTCATGDCGAISCPKITGTKYCTTSGDNDEPCESTSDPKCDSC